MSPIPRHECEPAFLGVERSALGRRWVARLGPAQAKLALALAQREGMPEIVARVIAARGATLDGVGTFLSPRIRDHMPDPHVLTDCEAAADRLAEAVTRGERVAVFGDYDVDGAASAALMARVLRALGTEVEIYIPDRLTEGYGPNDAAIDALCERGAGLIVTVDCGIASHGPIARAGARGVDCVVIDHHQAGENLPAARALVNPNRHDDLSGLGHLSAAGVAFMVAVALRRRLARADFPDPMGLLDLVALSTVCDMVPLRPLNRAFVSTGLAVMNRTRNRGLRALARASRIVAPLDAGALGFQLGPRINAGGRIGDAALGARLLTTEDEGEAERIAGELERLNRERRGIEAAALADAAAEAERELAGAAPPDALVTARDGWHAGIVGLVASRLRERFERPAFAIGFDGSGRGTGSGRSVPGLDLGRVVRDAVGEGILERGGGHAMAAGITIRRERLADFRAFAEERVRRADLDDTPVLEIDAALATGGATRELVERVDAAGPFGTGYPRPSFALADQLVEDVRPVGQGHVAVRLRGDDGRTLRAIAFRSADNELGALLRRRSGGRVHVAGALERDDYRGRSGAVLHMRDAAEAD